MRVLKEGRGIAVPKKEVPGFSTTSTRGWQAGRCPINGIPCGNAIGCSQNYKIRTCESLEASSFVVAGKSDPDRTGRVTFQRRYYRSDTIGIWPPPRCEGSVTMPHPTMARNGLVAVNRRNTFSVLYWSFPVQGILTLLR